MIACDRNKFYLWTRSNCDSRRATGCFSHRPFRVTWQWHGINKAKFLDRINNRGETRINRKLNVTQDGIQWKWTIEWFTHEIFGSFFHWKWLCDSVYANKWCDGVRRTKCTQSNHIASRALLLSVCSIGIDDESSMSCDCYVEIATFWLPIDRHSIPAVHA